MTCAKEHQGKSSQSNPNYPLLYIRIMSSSVCKMTHIGVPNKNILEALMPCFASIPISRYQPPYRFVIYPTNGHLIIYLFLLTQRIKDIKHVMPIGHPNRLQGLCQPQATFKIPFSNIHTSNTPVQMSIVDAHAMIVGLRLALMRGRYSRGYNQFRHLGNEDTFPIEEGCVVPFWPSVALLL